MRKFRFLLLRAIPYSRSLATIAALTLLGSVATLAIPWLAGGLLSGLLLANGTGLAPVVAMLLAALGAMTLLQVLTSIVSAKTSGRILADLRRDAYEHIVALPMAFHDRARQGELLGLMTYEVGNLSRFLTSTLATAPSILLTGGGTVILLFLIDPVMALVVPVLVPAFYLVLKLVGRKLRGLARMARKAEAMLMSEGEKQLEILPAIKSFAVESEERQQFVDLVEQARRLQFSQDRINAFLGPTISLVAALAVIGVLLLAGSRLQAEATDPAQTFSFLLYAALLTQPVNGIVRFYEQFQMAQGSLSRLQAVMRERREPGLDAIRGLHGIRGHIVFSQVSFAYRGRTATLSNIGFEIRPGETVALTGENGSGKSTLINLLLRFYEPASGRITLDGHDISQVQVQTLRRQFGLVPQRALLFNGTLRENIVFGHPDATEAQIETATRLAQAHDFIAELPRGMETEIGEHGVCLSGGQRQRIALARALLVDPPVLIFDEATSMYDLEGEAAFIDASRDALAGRTVIIVTHRPASLALAGRILLVEAGLVSEIRKDAPVLARKS